MGDFPTVNIKGKEYVLVKDRVEYFNKNFDNGAITTELLSEAGSGTIVIKATVTPDVKNPERHFTGMASETVGDGYINETAALENCETSAVGRAFAFMGIGIVDSIASADEMRKAENARKPKVYKPSEKQMNYLENIAFTYKMPDGSFARDADTLANHLINRSIKTQEDARELFELLKQEGVIDES